MTGTYVKWMIDKLPQNENEYVNEVIIFLETLLSTAQQILLCQVLKHVSQDVISQILESIVNFLVIQGAQKDNNMRVVEVRWKESKTTFRRSVMNLNLVIFD
ncbi:exocyst complex component SEC15B, partial [Tanacetum coccineum]